MSLEHIKQAIMAEAKAEAEKIEAEARSRCETKVEAGRAEIEGEFARREERSRLLAQQESHRRVMERRSRHNLALLQRRNAILDDLCRQAAERVTNLPDEEYSTVIEGWMKELPQDVGGEVLCNERDQVRLAPVVERLNASRPPHASLRLARHEEAFLGGVVFRTGKFEMDLSLDARVRRLREELAPQMSQTVFPDEVTV